MIFFIRGYDPFGAMLMVRLNWILTAASQHSKLVCMLTINLS